MFFPSPFTAAELKRGIRMIVHPISGKQLTGLTYDGPSRRFYTLVATVAWDLDPKEEFEPEIPVPDANVRLGDPLPPTWTFDPYTGNRIIQGY